MRLTRAKLRHRQLWSQTLTFNQLHLQPSAKLEPLAYHRTVALSEDVSSARTWPICSASIGRHRDNPCKALLFQAKTTCDSTSKRPQLIAHQWCQKDKLYLEVPATWTSSLKLISTTYKHLWLQVYCLPQLQIIKIKHVNRFWILPSWLVKPKLKNL